MRKLLALVLMLVMLTPSLVCAMPVCDSGAETAKSEKPCDGHAGHHEDKTKQINFMQDCTGVDLQLAFASSVDKADISKILYPVVFILPVQQQWMNNAQVLRGPPHVLTKTAEAYPPVFLTTQRIRI